MSRGSTRHNICKQMDTVITQCDLIMERFRVIDLWADGRSGPILDYIPVLTMALIEFKTACEKLRTLL